MPLVQHQISNEEEDFLIGDFETTTFPAHLRQVHAFFFYTIRSLWPRNTCRVVMVS